MLSILAAAIAIHAPGVPPRDFREAWASFRRLEKANVISIATPCRMSRAELEKIPYETAYNTYNAATQIAALDLSDHPDSKRLTAALKELPTIAHAVTLTTPELKKLGADPRAILASLNTLMSRHHIPHFREPNSGPLGFGKG